MTARVTKLQLGIEPGTGLRRLRTIGRARIEINGFILSDAPILAFPAHQWTLGQPCGPGQGVSWDRITGDALRDAVRPIAAAMSGDPHWPSVTMTQLFGPLPEPLPDTAPSVAESDSPSPTPNT